MRILTFLTFVIAMTLMVGMGIFLFSEDILYGIGGGYWRCRIFHSLLHQR